MRLSDEEYEEMEAMGLNNESAYMRHKWNEYRTGELQGMDSTESPKDLGTALALQRAEFENQRLREKVDELSRSKEETMNGIGDQVGQMLRDELMKRDHENLKKENERQGKEIDRLEAELRKSEKLVDDKSGEVAEMVKKLGYIELGKALLPSAINGLAKRYPKQLQGLASTLGELGGEMAALPEASASMDSEQEQLLAIAEYLHDLFKDSFDRFIAVADLMGQAQRMEETTLQKVNYYISQLIKVRNSNNKQDVDQNNHSTAVKDGKEEANRTEAENREQER